jgi:hypothetical protein
MAQKRPIPLPATSRKLVQGAVMLAIAAMQDERVRAQLTRAPAAARTWAASRRSADTGSAPNGLSRFDPTQRFGQKGIERRLTALQRNADLVFPDRDDATGAAIHQAIDELDRATAISETMALSERRRARGRITAELTRLEVALVDAVLPADQRP